MATEEERRRKREEQAALTGLTPDYIEMLERQLARQRGEGKPEGVGADYYTPPLTKYAPLAEDRRSERTGLMRPVGNIMDRLVRPGWQAEMNRRQHDLRGQRQAYAEQRPTRAAQQSALLTDTQLEALKQKALDPNADAASRATAMKLLSSYMQALKPPSYGSGGSGQSWRDIVNQFGEGGEASRDSAGSARPRTGDAPVTTSPTGEPVADTAADTAAEPVEESTEPSDIARRILRDDFRHGATLALYPEEAIQQATSKLKARKVNEQQILALAKGDLAQHPDHPQTTKYIQKAEARIAEIDSKLSAISGRPAAGSGTATTAPRP